MKRMFSMGRFALSVRMGAVLIAFAVFDAAPSIAQQNNSQANNIDVDAYTIDAQINPGTQTLNAHVVVRSSRHFAGVLKCSRNSLD